MIPCVVFLNELSYRYEGDKAPAGIVASLLSSFKAIKAAQKIRRDLVVAGSSPISKIAIGDGTHSVASLLHGDYHKDQWRFIKGLDQSSPGDASWNFNRPHPLKEVTFDGQRTFGMLWANESRSLVVSLALSPNWNRNEIAARLETMTELGMITFEDISVPNVSNPDHVNEHRELIANYGKDVSASSIIYQGDDFVARMYFFDHNPPHFHVCSLADPAKTLATYDIRTLDVLSGSLTGSLQRAVAEWTGSRRTQLMDNWTRCGTGEHPFLLNG